MSNKDTPKRQSAIKATIASMYRGAVSEGEDGGNWDACDGAAVSLQFANGKELLITSQNLSNAVFYRALAHGIKQKLVDAAAISRNPETGRSATIEDKFSAVSDVYQRLLSGLWNEPREGGGNLGGILLKALCRVYPKKDAAALKEWLAGKSEAEKTALRANPKIAEAIAAIQAEAAANAGIDSDDLLDQLDDEADE